MNDLIWRPGPSLARLQAGDERYVELFAHGSLRLELYAPRGHDPQSPHDQDELYIVQQGSGRFRRGAQVCKFDTGDVLFVAAGVEHRFEDFSDDLVWVVFCGPKGGESLKQGDEA
jgi:mannose-6-phosphate isomerase-like protein (cupin superfamily)